MTLTGRQAADLDRWITGNYGEDAFRESPPPPECACGHDIKQHEDMGDWYAHCQEEGCLCSEYVERTWDDDDGYEGENE